MANCCFTGIHFRQAGCLLHARFLKSQVLPTKNGLFFLHGDIPQRFTAAAEETAQPASPVFRGFFLRQNPPSDQSKVSSLQFCVCKGFATSAARPTAQPSRGMKWVAISMPYHISLAVGFEPITVQIPCTRKGQQHSCKTAKRVKS